MGGASWHEDDFSCTHPHPRRLQRLAFSFLKGEGAKSLRLPTQSWGKHSGHHET